MYLTAATLKIWIAVSFIGILSLGDRWLVLSLYRRLGRFKPLLFCRDSRLSWYVLLPSDDRDQVEKSTILFPLTDKSGFTECNALTRIRMFSDSIRCCNDISGFIKKKKTLLYCLLNCNFLLADKILVHQLLLSSQDGHKGTLCV